MDFSQNIFMKMQASQEMLAYDTLK